MTGWRERLGQQAGPEPVDQAVRDREVMLQEFEALNPLEQVNVGTRGMVRSLVSGINSQIPSADQLQVAEFENRERPAIEASRSGGMGYGTVGEIIPGLAVRGGPFWQALVAGAESGLAAPPGERINTAMRSMGEAYAFGKTLDVGAAALQKGKRLGQEIRQAELEAVHGPGQIIQGTPAPKRTVGQRMADIRSDLLAALPAGPDLERDSRMLLAGEADRLGIKLTPGQRSGNRARQKFEAGMESNAVLGGPFDDLIDQNQVRYGELAAAAIGERGAKALTPEVLGRATERLGRTFGQVTEELGAVVPDMADPASEAAGRFMNRIQQARAGEVADIRTQRVVQGEGIQTVESQLKVKPIVDVIEALAGGGDLNAAKLVEIRSSLADEIHALANDRGGVARGSQIRGLSDIVDAVDNLIVESAGEAGVPELAERYATGRMQWRMLQAMQQGRATDALGEVRAKSVDGILRREYPREYRRGGLTGEDGGRGGQLQDVANFMDATRVGSALLRDIVGNSGTATRSLPGQLMADPSGGITQLATRAIVGGPLTRLSLKVPSLGPAGETPEWLRNLGAQVGGAEARKREEAARRERGK